MLLAAAIQARFPGATVAVEGDHVVAEIDGFTARARLAPLGHVIVGLDCDGFELDVRWTDRASSTRAATFDDSFLVETNDVALAGAWLDGYARAALLASRYVSDAPLPERMTATLVRDGAWRHFIRGGSVGAVRGDAEPNVERVADMLVTTLALAQRPARWARGWAALARELGGDAATRVELGGRPVIRARRAGVDVTVRLLRRLAADEAGRLRTLVGAHRHGSGGDTLTLITDDLPRAAWPPANVDPRAAALRIDARARELLDRARPATTIVRPHDVEITFDGALADRDRLDAAIELCAHWAGGRDEPYR